MLRFSRITQCKSLKRIESPWVISQTTSESILTWKSAPKKVLVSKKYNDTRARDAMTIVCNHLREKGAEVLIDSNDPDREIFSDYSAASCGMASTVVDFVVCLGGDGTVLRTVGWIGECAEAEVPRIPPVLAIGVGSLGFLAPFAIADYKAVLDRIMDSDAALPVTLRSRLLCEVFEPNQLVTPQVSRRVLNECLVARGSHSAFQQLDCTIDNMRVAQFQADGLIVATPSGSSAYSMAAGGPLVAPTVPSILLTPVAPHALSARPLVIPSTSTVEVHVPRHARARPIVSFDGHHELVLERDSRVRIRQSKSDVPFFRLPDSAAPNADWFVSLRSKLHWAKEVRNPAL